ncbi:MAG: hypothetical protein Q9164_001422 [Protoblastenia rupestris]
MGTKGLYARGTHTTDPRPWTVRYALRGGFCELDKRGRGYNRDECDQWPHSHGKEKLYRVEDLRREPFIEDLRVNLRLEPEFRYRKENGEYDHDMLPQYSDADFGRDRERRPREAFGVDGLEGYMGGSAGGESVDILPRYEEQASGIRGGGGNPGPGAIGQARLRDNWR